MFYRDLDISQTFIEDDGSSGFDNGWLQKYDFDNPMDLN